MVDGIEIGRFMVKWIHHDHTVPAHCLVTQVYIEDGWRRQGWWTRTWKVLTARFPGITHEWPCTPAMEAFIRNVTRRKS
jgi:hypothetical protein